MLRRKLRDLEMRESEKLERALDRRKYREALSLCERLPYDFRIMHKISTNTMRGFLAQLEVLFDYQQKKYTEAIKESINRKHITKAKEILKLKSEDYSELHHIYLEFKAKIFSYVYKYCGPERLFDVLRAVGEQQKENFLKAMSLSIEDIVKSSAMIMKGHPKGKLKVKEDKKKFIFICDPCGSGGVLLNEGYYNPPTSLATIKHPLPMTWKNNDFPSYCVHCAIWNEILPIEWVGYPYWVHKPPKKENDPCIFYVYKNQKDIPKEHYELLKQ